MNTPMFALYLFNFVGRSFRTLAWLAFSAAVFVAGSRAGTPTYYDATLIPTRNTRLTTQVCIYGATPAGLSALLECSRSGVSAILLHPGSRIGGMTASGLGATDVGKKESIGGISREFYRRVGAYYNVAEEWAFEPKVALAVFNDMVKESGLPVYTQAWVQSVSKTGTRIDEITCIGGLRVQAKYFMDCSYEGDLLKAAGVSYRTGRDGNALFNESSNGQQISVAHQFDTVIDPYKIPGKPESGLVAGVDASTDFVKGAADTRIQAYNFRLCLTRDFANGLEFEKPADYDDSRYELLRRYVNSTSSPLIWLGVTIRNGKTDTNNTGPFSTDFIGGNQGFPEASYEERERLYQAQRSYQQGWLYFLRNDPTVPLAIRLELYQNRLAKDEFVETGGWPPQLYIRESRRLIGENVVTEDVCLSKTAVTDSVGLGSYTMDSHACRRFVQNGRVRNEGDVQVAVPKPYGISYRALLPKRAEATNLIVPVCVSASHIAFGSIRMEPVYMILGQSAALACSVALQSDSALQDVPYSKLRPLLSKRGQLVGGEPFARLTNISTRHLAAPQRPLIMGWNVGGGTSDLLARSAGPSLIRFGVDRPVAAVAIAGYNLSGTPIQSGASASDEAITASKTVGAFTLSFPDREGAMVMKGIAGGTLTADAVAGDSGAALAEIYLMEASGTYRSLSNLSTRASAESGQPLIVGFTVAGSGQTRLLLRAIGPALKGFSVSDAAADVSLTVLDGAGHPLASNQDWSTGTDVASIRAASAAAGAFPLTDGSKDAALLLNLSAGSYSAHSLIGNGGVGQVMFEAYDLGLP